MEAFVNFEYEITLLTLTQRQGPTLFCPPIGHRQEGGDYQESWQPMPMEDSDLLAAQEMAAQVTSALGGAGIWGVEFFIAKDGVYFSELSPRPHDTGMVTLAGTQQFNEFELHLRAILGIPVTSIPLERPGASAVILANGNSDAPEYSGVEEVAGQAGAQLRLFGKPDCRPGRRMGVVATYGTQSTPVEELVEKARKLADKITVMTP